MFTCHRGKEGYVQTKNKQLIQCKQIKIHSIYLLPSNY